MPTSRTVGIVLAGGRSRRMGVDKAGLLLFDKPLVAWVVGALRAVIGEVRLVGGSPQLARDLGVGFVPDLLDGAGPLAGIYAGLCATGADVLVSACDTPLLQAPLLEGILRSSDDFDAVVPINQGEYEPLIGVYRQACLPPIAAVLGAGKRQVRSVFGEIRLGVVAEAIWRRWDPKGLSFLNANTPEDLARIQGIIEQQGLWKAQTAS